MTTRGKTNYLVFERAEPRQDVPPMQTSSGPARQMADGSWTDANSLLGYRCIGGVRATDPERAIQAVIRATRRVGAYAVIEATFLDFTKSLDADVEADTPLLNP